MSSVEPSSRLSRDDTRTLLDVADRAIANGLRTGEEPSEDATQYSPRLQEHRATFVTVERNGDLMGCIGSLSPRLPLVADVAKNAYGAIFIDPRCPRITEADLEHLELHISVLGTPEPMSFVDEADLVRQLRPGVDGLILEEDFARGTFLPSVWETLPEPEAFFTNLKLKAGLPPTYWSTTLRVKRYTTEAYSRSDT